MNSPAPAAMGKPDYFFPVYEVKCSADRIKYELEIDAVSGAVLESEAESR